MLKLLPMPEMKDVKITEKNIATYIVMNKNIFLLFFEFLKISIYFKSVSIKRLRDGNYIPI